MRRPDLILVRHARPQVEANAPPPLWRLSPQGRADAARLADRLRPFAPTAVVASAEPKAIETAEILAAPLGLPVASDARLDEHRRAAWPFELDPAAVAARVRHALAEPDAGVEGAEPVRDAAARFEAGIGGHAGRPLLVVSHGTVLSAWLAPRLGWDAGVLWAGLAAPEAFVLDGEGRLLERLA
jgi:broad specificity phosphatase PhoE